MVGRDEEEEQVAAGMVTRLLAAFGPAYNISAPQNTAAPALVQLNDIVSQLERLVGIEPPALLQQQQKSESTSKGPEKTTEKTTEKIAEKTAEKECDASADDIRDGEGTGDSDGVEVELSGDGPAPATAEDSEPSANAENTSSPPSQQGTNKAGCCSIL